MQTFAAQIVADNGNVLEVQGPNLTDVGLYGIADAFATAVGQPLVSVTKAEAVAVEDPNA